MSRVCPTCHGTKTETFSAVQGAGAERVTEIVHEPCWTCGATGELPTPVFYGIDQDTLDLILEGKEGK